MKEEIKAVAENVLVVEKATNSMKDAMIESTAKAAFLEGEKSERDKTP